jgi:hypothetical protein
VWRAPERLQTFDEQVLLYGEAQKVRQWIQEGPPGPEEVSAWLERMRGADLLPPHAHVREALVMVVTEMGWALGRSPPREQLEEAAGVLDDLLSR